MWPGGSLFSDLPFSIFDTCFADRAFVIRELNFLFNLLVTAGVLRNRRSSQPQGLLWTEH